jgi:uncharacterized repeat protein (TIGR03806 family)
MLRVMLLLGLLLGVMSCSLDTEDPAPSAQPDEPDLPEPPSGEEGGGDNTDPPHGMGARERLPGLNFPLDGDTAQRLRAVEAFPNLPRFSELVYLAHDGTSNRLYAVEKQGVIRYFVNKSNVTVSDVWLDIRDRVRNSGEMGLLGLAFDPLFASNGLFYVHYNHKDDGRSVVARYRAKPGDLMAEAASAEEILSLSQPFSNHNGGSIEFGRDGYLYIALGDGGSGDDPNNYGLNKSVWWGKILRIAPNRDRPGYTVPNDNPWVGANDGSKPEIWAYGLRNPWRMSFDRQTGALWVGDVGQNVWEEVNIVTEGGNYGWKTCEGLHARGSRRQLCTEVASETLLPIVEHSHDEGWRSLTGGYVYRGSRLPNLFGQYLYGDYESGEVWALRHQDGRLVDTQKVASIPGNLSSFAQDGEGEVFALAIQGTIYRFEQNTASAEFPRTLSATGLFADVAQLHLVAGVIPYEVNAPLWSDGARKRRWIALPNETQISVKPDGRWEFPVGTVLIKHFDAPVDAVPRYVPLETRVLLKQNNQWAAYTYAWNAQQTDADLVTTGRDITLSMYLDGAQQDRHYRLPGSGECMSCHNSASSHVLGVRVEQLDRDYAYTQVMDNQLRAWSHIGLFHGNVTKHQPLVELSSDSASLDARVRSYLDVNCAICHQPAAIDAVGLDLRYATSLADTGLLRSAERSAGDIVIKGQPEQSVLWQRAASDNSAIRMPRGSRHADPQFIAALRQWIVQL